MPAKCLCNHISNSFPGALRKIKLELKLNCNNAMKSQDFSSWMLVVMVAVQAAAGSIFLFEWISPSGYNMTQSHNQAARDIRDCYYHL